MKYRYHFQRYGSYLSPSMRREWIEMVVVTCVITVISMSPSMRREWIEISNEHDLHQTAKSLPPCGGSGLKYLSGYLRGRRQQSPSMRREWIEMPVEYTKYIGSLRNVGVVKSICKQVQMAAYQCSNHGISATGGFISHGYSFFRNRVSFVN